ncbi:MAG: hypothetical protein KatS3mg077_0349 [Candidatus Binatia bacterium]|nr:MAG: hypothetical protein KatS3mg077_0349 [Candidatus Binatia bacterium]
MFRPGKLRSSACSCPERQSRHFGADDGVLAYPERVFRKSPEAKLETESFGFTVQVDG